MSQEKIKRALDKMSYYTRSAKQYKEALAEINKIVMDCLPKKKETTPKANFSYFVGRGFNQAIAEFEANWEGK